ncbi:hypothetical protein TSAR_006043 [Trichomalopsis sarcophagae]|uniref:Uncharacterized protein n=1 Tax=Trichomalopsis sarcophagae TaxID=543379 RepID=A0A232FER0_9HYME|nr:hypothetical protein TSAR_006043 [Trichomalopsis sarcophagae]
MFSVGKVLQEKVNINNDDNIVNDAKSVILFAKLLLDSRPFKYDINLALYHILSLSEFQTLKPQTYVDGSVINSYMIANRKIHIFFQLLKRISYLARRLIENIQKHGKCITSTLNFKERYLFHATMKSIRAF